MAFPSRLAAGFALAATLLLGLGLSAVAEELPAEPVIKSGKASVRIIQQQLQRNGYAPGPVNGLLDSRTRAAVRSFERDCGLSAGTAGGSLTEKLIKPERCSGASR